ncbi:hypothetical protein [Streptomyces sp. NPDC014894]|uniref:SCO6745 family protein n=1 Tax=unclassified Streptomyces TaxID=2593676 RepID=UPI0036FC8727
MTSQPLDSMARAGRRCHHTLNAMHSTVYFSPDLRREMSALGVEDAVAPLLLTRAAALGPVSAGAVTGLFYNFSHEQVARCLPAAWETASPSAVLDARLRAADGTLRRLLGEEVVASAELAEAAELALRATRGCARPGRPLYSAHADLPVPAEPHLAYWHAATLLREHRGDGHVSALLTLDLDPLEAVITHTATGRGMATRLNRATRGWPRAAWDSAHDRLLERGLLDADGDLTPAGVTLRAELEDLTDRLDQGPYDHLGAAGVARLTSIGQSLVKTVTAAGAFPADAFGR